MRSAKASMTGLFVAASFVACAKDPVGVNVDPQLNIAADSVTINLFTSASVGAVNHNTLDALQYVSRDQNVATVNAFGAVTGVAVGSTYVVAALPSHPNVRDSVRVRVYSDSCGGARPAFGAAVTAEDRNLFSYDVNAPLNLQKTVLVTNNGVERSGISYNSPDGGSVTGFIWDPVTRSGLRPGIVIMHGHPSNANTMSGMALNYAQYGAVVIAIDAPFARRAGGAMTILPLDAAEQIQVIKDLQRAVDVLRSHPNVDDDRIAYIGVIWGGATGALFVGIERRLKAAALVVGHPGQVSHATGPGGFKNILVFPCARRVAWIRAMAPVEPIRFVGNANVPLLLQNGTMDEFIPEYEAAELHAAAPQPKTIRWYAAGHSLNQQALFDRHDWLVEKIGIDPRQQ
ncbi:MAG TPA: acetylxylan esterase [Casimicrobiaceae bacterium]|nr:acetylxylan esterase [Casimicrobiaceae bacterium]